MTDQDRPGFLVLAKGLYKTFHREEDAVITNILFITLQHLTFFDAEQCVTQAILTCEKFPTPVELKRCIGLIPRRDVPRVTYNPQSSQKLADESMRLITAVMDGKINQGQLIEGMRQMDQRHPGDGWATEAAGLVQFYRGIDEPMQEAA